MNEKQAKGLRKALLPTVRRDAGCSRGTLMRNLTEYELERVNLSRVRIVNKPGTPRRIYLDLKRKFDAATK